MTTADIRAHFAALDLPETLDVGPHLHIADLHKFIETQVERLESDGPAILQYLAIRDLNRIAEKLNHPFPIE